MEKENISYIALGSNIGDRFDNLSRAGQEIIKDKNNKIENVSSIYETLPYGYKDQGNFYNAVIKIKTGYELIELLDLLKSIERGIGREKSPRWGPREIDLDILFYNDLIFSNERITIPHKEVSKRDFVLIPLCEIAPELNHPVLKQKICDICIADSEKTVIGKIQQKLTFGIKI
ncbi:MAG: 2-amino-4-hydroxy-6-hydroxymethyldihydropteridine diphosphokinase [Ignavibacteriaceae bacterium]|nr:2-amino-4-hydroxy-6-hydroxymethyldihydropteridine diphosphokinase [Ignavibacteriaceae bacterium]